MVKRIAALTAILATVAIVAAVAVQWYRTQTNEQTTPSDAAQAPYRVVGVWEGQVAVFLPDAVTPETVYDTPLAVLPAAERARLTAGVAVADSAALARLLEDYLS